MKKLSVLLLIVSILCSCETYTQKQKEQMQNQYLQHYYEDNYKIVIMDSCEYIIMGRRGDDLTHKGNCRFCTERNKLNP